MNKLKEPVIEETVEAQEPAPAPRKKSKPSGIKRSFLRLNSVFGIFDRNQIAQQMPFILFVSLLLICYISNSYYAEGIIRDIDKTKAELKEKRAEYISTSSRLMYQSNQSEVAKSLAPFQIIESIVPPEKIFITETVQK